MTTRNKYVVFVIFVVVAFGVAACFVIAAKQPQQSTPAMSQTAQGLDLNKLPSDFVFVKDKGHHYYLYRDMNNFYLVWQDDTFANSVHITWLGLVNR